VNGGRNSAVYHSLTSEIMSDIDRIREKIGFHPDFPKKVRTMVIRAFSYLALGNQLSGYFPSAQRSTPDRTFDQSLGDSCYNQDAQALFSGQDRCSCRSRRQGFHYGTLGGSSSRCRICTSPEKGKTSWTNCPSRILERIRNGARHLDPTDAFIDHHG
jgi:hypothetical protein